MANKEAAKSILYDIDTAVQNLIKAMPGIDCDVVQTELKNINNAVSNLLAEAENHG